MQLGEALSQRSHAQKRLAQLQDRLRASVLIQEGEEPPERAEDLLAEVDSVCDELQGLIARINHTNSGTTLSTGETVTEALARRDVLGLRQSALRAAARTGAGDGLVRITRSEIRMVRQIRVAEIQSRIDALAREQRELDTMLQAHNWTVALIE